MGARSHDNDDKFYMRVYGAELSGNSGECDCTNNKNT
jgi:hypothetical protein